MLKTCAPTQLPGSDKAAKGSIKGVIGSTMQMTCQKGFQSQLKVEGTCMPNQKFKFSGACNGEDNLKLTRRLGPTLL